MSHPNFPQVSHKELEERVRQAHLRERIGAFFLVIATIGLTVYWLQRFAPVMPWWGAGIFLISLFWLIGSSDIPHGVLLEKAKPEKLGNYTPEQLHAIVREVCETFYEKEIPNIYIIEDTAEAMAAVVNVDILTFVKPWNALYISPYLLHTLEPDELKAVLSHEMCHFSLYYTFWTRYFYVKFVIFAVWMTVALSFLIQWTSSWFQSGWWILHLLLIYVVLQLGKIALNVVVVIISMWTSRPDSQEVEALCDYEAVKRYGLLPMVNVLLKTGTRQEIFTTLVAQFSPNLERPIEGLAEAASHEAPNGNTEERQQLVVNQALAMQAAYMKLNEILPLDFLSLEDSAPYLEEAVRTGLNETEARRYTHAPRQVVRWLKHDINVANQQLDRVEYETFIKELKQNPDKPLFYIAEEIDQELASNAEHPTFRNRILFLEYNTHPAARQG